METKFYKWWKGHRRVVTFGGFLVLFAWYLSPLIQSAKDKNNCINMISISLFENEYKKLGRKDRKNIARADAYVICSTGKRANMK